MPYTSSNMSALFCIATCFERQVVHVRDGDDEPVFFPEAFDPGNPVTV